MINSEAWPKVFDKLREQFPGRQFDLRLLQDGASVECIQMPQSTAPSVGFDSPRYSLGCIQALLEAVMLELLRNEGVIDPTAPIGYYLPELLTSGARSAGEHIRVQDAISNATGYHIPSGFMESGCFDEVISYLENSKGSFPPGTVCSWNNLGRYLLSELVRRATGEDVSKLVQSALHGADVSDAVVRREKSGWPDIELSLEELMMFISRTIGPGGAASELMMRIAAASVPVVRRPVSSRSGYPIAYAHGIARYPDSLWGQNGVGLNYALGVRFNQDISFLHCLSVQAGPSVRDLVLQLLANAGGYKRDPSPKYSVGAIVGCDIADLEGSYTADGEDRIEVTISANKIICSVFRGKDRVALIELLLIEDNILLADTRWNSLQIEFFLHPDSGTPCLVLGQISYVKATSP